VITGTTNPSEEKQLKAGSHLAWLYIGKLDGKTIKEKKNYQVRNNVTGRIYCNELETKGYKVFKVGFPYTSLEEINRRDF
jgi:hypothetical protein